MKQHTGLALHDGYAPHSHEIRPDHLGVPGFADDCRHHAGPPLGCLPPEGHLTEARQLLREAGHLLRNSSAPRGPLELGVLAIAHAITALASEDLLPPDPDTMEWSAGESADEGGSGPDLNEGGSCPSCGSDSRAEAGYIPGRNGPVSCDHDWHDADARSPGDHLGAETRTALAMWESAAQFAHNEDNTRKMSLTTAAQLIEAGDKLAGIITRSAGEFADEGGSPS